eukprot:7160377-Prymnesium_polylepis.1
MRRCGLAAGVAPGSRCSRDSVVRIGVHDVLGLSPASRTGRSGPGRVLWAGADADGPLALRPHCE